MPEVAALQSVPTSPQVAPSASASHHMSFRDILSALNPLQYLPVIGTIYRAVTGDQIPEPLQRVGSLIASGLLGGPVGVLIGVAVMMGEKVSGIDLDKAGQRMLTGVAPARTPAAAPEQAPVRAPEQAPVRAPEQAPVRAPEQAPVRAAGSDSQALPIIANAEVWSPVQLTAYRVSAATGDMGGQIDLSDADALNALELSRLQMARSAYSRAVGLVP